MSYRSTQFLDPRYDDITCESIDCSGTIYTVNLVVTGSASFPAQQDISVNNETVQTLLVENSLTCNGSSNLSNVDCSGNLQVSGSMTCATGNVTNANVTTLTVNQNNQGGAVIYGGVTTYSSGTLAYNSQFGNNLDWLGYYLSLLLPSSVAPASSSNLSVFTTLFTFSSLPIGVYSCMGSLRLFASSGSTVFGCFVQAVQNNNSAIVPFEWNDNFTNATTLTSNMNLVLPTNFTFYNNINNGNIVLQIAPYYSGTFYFLAPQTSYLQITRIA